MIDDEMIESSVHDPELDDDAVDDRPPSAKRDRHAATPPKQAGVGERRTYDWGLIKARYVEGVKNQDAGITEWPSLDAVATHFEVSPTRVREKSAMEGWVEQRNRWQAHVETVRRNAKAAAAVRNGEVLDGRAVDTAKLGLQLCLARLSEIAQEATRARSATMGEGAKGGIDAQEQQRLAQAVDLWHKIGLRAIGDPETHRLEISGPNGQPLEIATELRRDDPTRMAGVLGVLRAAGLGDVFGAGDGDAGGEDVGLPAADGEPSALEARR